MPAGSGDLLPEEKRCTATAKQTGVRCGQAKVPGMEVCHYHGGKTPSGLASANFKTGRYSRVLPERLMQRYHEALEDNKLLEQREEIALMQARKQDLLDAGESHSLWKEVLKLKREYIAITRSKKLSREEKSRLTSEKLVELFEAIERGTADSRNWNEIMKVENMTVRIRESERRYLLEQRQMMSIEEVMTLMVAVSDAIKRHVREAGIRNALAGELRRLTHISSGDVIEHPGDTGHRGRGELEA